MSISGDRDGDGRVPSPVNRRGGKRCFSASLLLNCLQHRITVITAHLLNPESHPPASNLAWPVPCWPPALARAPAGHPALCPFSYLFLRLSPLGWVLASPRCYILSHKGKPFSQTPGAGREWGAEAKTQWMNVTYRDYPYGKEDPQTTWGSHSYSACVEAEPSL